MGKGKGKKGSKVKNVQNGQAPVVMKNITKKRFPIGADASTSQPAPHPVLASSPAQSTNSAPAQAQIPDISAAFFASPEETIANGNRVATVESNSQQVDGDKLAGYIFMCNGQTKPECYKHRVFGLPSGSLDVVKNIKKGTKLFLYDFQLKLLYGIYEAASDGGQRLAPSAFGGRFPAQVAFHISKDCLPLPLHEFRNAIQENYRGHPSKFRPELGNLQVQKLTAMFHPIDLHTTPGSRAAPPLRAYQPQVTENEDQPLRRPPTPYRSQHRPPHANLPQVVEDQNRPVRASCAFMAQYPRAPPLSSLRNPYAATSEQIHNHPEEVPYTIPYQPRVTFQGPLGATYAAMYQHTRPVQVSDPDPQYYVPEEPAVLMQDPYARQPDPLAEHYRLLLERERERTAVLERETQRMAALVPPIEHPPENYNTQTPAVTYATGHVLPQSYAPPQPSYSAQTAYVAYPSFSTQPPYAPSQVVSYGHPAPPPPEAQVDLQTY